jgi:hypothetical protein
MVRISHRSFLVALAAGSSLLAGPASAQTAAYSDVPQRFRLEAGGFRIGADTELTFNAIGTPKDPVNFESLDLPTSATRFYVEGFWRPWRRHEFSLSWYRNARDGEANTAQRDFTWGEGLITAGATVSPHASSSYLSGVYRFAAYKNDRFEIGPSLGIGHLSVTAGFKGTATIETGLGNVSVPFDIDKGLGQITGDLGGYFYWWPIRRLLVRADMRYIIIKPENSEASVADGRGAVIYHPWRNVGIGLQYTYTKFRYDRDIFSKELGGTLRYSGGQVVLAGAF